MKKLIRVLFGISDVVLAILLLTGVWALIQVYFAFLDVTIPGGTDEFRPILDAALPLYGLPSLTAITILLLVIGTLQVLGYLLSFFLLLQKQVFGLFIMLIVDVVSILFSVFNPGIILAAVVRWLVLGLPWLLTWRDMKKQGPLS